MGKFESDKVPDEIIVNLTDCLGSLSVDPSDAELERLVARFNPGFPEAVLRRVRISGTGTTDATWAKLRTRLVKTEGSAPPLGPILHAHSAIGDPPPVIRRMAVAMGDARRAAAVSPAADEQ